MPEMEKLSDQLEAWLASEGPKSLGSLVEAFAERSFAILFLVLLAIPALPLPTGGVTHVFELIAMLLALELLVGRRHVWLPERLRRREIGAATQKRFRDVLLKRIRWLEAHSRPRLGFLISRRASDVVYGAVVLILSLTAFLAPPFTGLDTLPALGVVVLSVGVLLRDGLLSLIGLLIGAAGVVLVFILGRATYEGISSIF